MTSACIGTLSLYPSDLWAHLWLLSAAIIRLSYARNTHYFRNTHLIRR